MNRLSDVPVHAVQGGGVLLDPFELGRCRRAGCEHVGPHPRLRSGPGDGGAVVASGRRRDPLGADRQGQHVVQRPPSLEGAGVLEQLELDQHPSGQVELTGKLEHRCPSHVRLHPGVGSLHAGALEDAHTSFRRRLRTTTAPASASPPATTTGRHAWWASAPAPECRSGVRMSEVVRVGWLRLAGWSAAGWSAVGWSAARTAPGARIASAVRCSTAAVRCRPSWH